MEKDKNLSCKYHYQKKPRSGLFLIMDYNPFSKRSVLVGWSQTSVGPKY